MRRRPRLLGRALAAGFLAVAASAGAQPPPPPPPAGPPVTVGAAVQGEVAYAQLAAYEQYLLYFALVSNQSASGPAPDLTQYFRNGAVVTSVPSTGPGAAYFNNGAGVTSVPSSGPGAAYFTNGAEATKYPLNAAAAPPAASPESPAATPWTPAEPPPPAATSTMPVAARQQAVASVTLIDGPPMSFEAWLRATRSAAMGAEASYAPSAAARSASTEATPIEESSAAANDERERGAYPLPEKPAERALARRRSGRLVAYAALAFAIGALLGALVMRRRRPGLPAAHQR